MKELVEFYIDQFRQSAQLSEKKGRLPKYQHKIQAMTNVLRNTKGAPGREAVVTQFHKDVKRLVLAAYFYNNKAVIQKVNRELLPELVRMDLELLNESETGQINKELLKGLQKSSPREICNRSLKEVLHSYNQKNLRRQIMQLVPARPEMEFTEALAMERRFILHIGPTNSGKTYQALESLKNASKGVYLGPLRLLALEVYEKMHDGGVPCTMMTGQECIEDPDSRITAATIEMLDVSQEYEIAVIDEAQMVADELRGHSWTRAIMGVRAGEIHVCMSPAAEPVVIHLIKLCGASYEIRRYERKTPLELEEAPFVFPDDVREGDALIAFSKRSVLNIAGRLEQAGIESSVIYGSLPPEIRRRQMTLFNSGETKVVVSTDAIGMGLNLPVRRIVFMECEKYDGKRVRPLEVSEIRQIAGRAGRYGIHEAGYVTAMEESRLRFLKKQWDNEEPLLDTVSLGFPQVLLSMDAPLDVILKLWHSVKPSAPFEKINIEEMLFLYKEAYKMRAFIADFDDKHILYRMVTCPIDIKDRELVHLWGEYCMNYTADICLDRPRKHSRYQGLLKYESYYKKLDLYYQLSMRLGKLVDNAWLEEEREETQDKIMQLLAKDKREYILRCKYCGRVLPVESASRVCERCRKAEEENNKLSNG